MKYIISFLLVVIFSCAPKSEFIKSIESDGSGILVGSITREVLFKENPEWELGIKFYKPDQVIMDSLKNVTKDLSVDIFLGTWCGDSRREVPHFFKIVDELNIKLFNEIHLWAVDRSIKLPASNLVEEKNIKYVATFIIYDADEELGRVVEQPQNTLESDILKIITDN